MAEFLTMDDANGHYASKGKGNAGLTLGIIGTALGALGSGILGGNGNGILGLGNGRSNAGSAMAGFAAGAAMADASGRSNSWYGPSNWDLVSRETADQEYDLVRMGQIQYDGLKNAMEFREKDIAEKADIYRQTKADNNVLQGKLDCLARGIENARFESFKNTAELAAASNIADKDLEIQIERNREVDQREKFELYKDLSTQTNRLAYDTMKTSYENKIESMNQMANLAQRISRLESKEAVNSATIPLMFQLSHADTKIATCKKIDGDLTLNWTKINNPFPGGPFYNTTETQGCNCGC